MDGVGLADMLIALYRINVKTKRWYIKVFWHLTDICKVNAWNIYCRHFAQLGTPRSKMLSLCEFSHDLASALMHANKMPRAVIGRPSKRLSNSNVETQPSKKAVVATPCNDICYDQVGHWPEAVEKKE